MYKKFEVVSKNMNNVSQFTQSLEFKNVFFTSTMLFA